MDMLATLKKKPLVAAAVVVVVALLAWWAWNSLLDSGPGEGFVSGNGRIEATEIDVATKLPGRIEDILVREGDFVTAGQPLARMQLDTLDAQRAEAEAGRQQAEHGATAAEAQVVLRQSDVAAARAQVAQRETELDAARRRFARSETLAAEGAASVQELDDDRARVRGAEAALAATRAQVAAAEAAVAAGRARLRPILMTSLAMVIGLLPLMFASGVGANGNSTLGTGAIGGMLIGMICQIFIVPALFVIFQYLQEKVKPMEWEDIDNTDAVTEIEQYAK